MATTEPTPPLGGQPAHAGPEMPAGEALLQLAALVARLRSEQGCPWDRQQTPSSLIPYMLEETYEVIESIAAGDHQALKEELGDVLLHIVFQSRIAEEQQQFTLAESIRAAVDKLIRRHPHVFGDARVPDTATVRQRWEVAKQREKGRESLLDGVPRTLPALTRAHRVQEKAASVGFDWSDIAAVWAKVEEEIAELRTAQRARDPAAIAEEFGDVLFSLVNLGRFLHLNAEEALRQAIAKFEHRFRGIERELARRGRRLDEASLEEMDALWDRFRRCTAPRQQGGTERSDDAD
ncbi:MAG: nucleoside triphosphate pyrophosphohydrolase [candidate division KSB1 bacterium]|nr:nucleoside triphosphate pyrophosphohydrolase [candidate division KSB1 bacterium]